MLPDRVYTPPMTPVRVVVDDPAGGPPSWLTIPGEPTAVPELFVIPSAFAGGYEGRWVVVHAPTGLVIPVYTASVGQARDVAVRLAALGVEWSVAADAAALSARIGADGWAVLAGAVAEFIDRAAPPAA